MGQIKNIKLHIVTDIKRKTMSAETSETPVGQTDYKWTPTSTTEGTTEEATTEEANTAGANAQETTTEEATGEDAKQVHPYKDKLETFKPKEWQLKKQMPQSSAPLEDHSCTFVDTVTLLTEMMAELRKVKELAINIHSEKFTHFNPTCSLLEISTRTHDYIVDAITLKDELKVLNEITSDENILKIMYSTGHSIAVKYQRQGDLEVMARSLGLWVLNLFEIISALRLTTGLEAKFGNIGELLKKHCYVELKGLGKENVWTNRPLSEDQIKHLRTRVHYMLYIHDLFRNELIEKRLLEKLYEQCTNICKASNNPVCGPDSHINLYKTIYRKEKREFNHRQMECFRLLSDWRYKTAKENDKGLTNVLQTKDMFKLAKELPAEVEGVAKCFTDEILPPLVESDLQIVHGLILQAIKEVKDLSKVKIDSSTGSAKKRSSTSNQNQNFNSAKRGRGGNHRGQRGNFNFGPGHMRGRGQMTPGANPMRGRGMPRQPWMQPAMGRGMGPQMGPGYGQRMGPMMGNMSQARGSFGQQMGPTGAMGSPGFLDQVINEVVGEVTQKMTQQAMGYGNNTYGMMNSRGRGGPRGTGRGGHQGRGFGRR